MVGQFINFNTIPFRFTSSTELHISPIHVDVYTPADLNFHSLSIHLSIHLAINPSIMVRRPTSRRLVSITFNLSHYSTSPQPQSRSKRERKILEFVGFHLRLFPGSFSPFLPFPFNIWLSCLNPTKYMYTYTYICTHIHHVGTQTCTHLYFLLSLFTSAIRSLVNGLLVIFPSLIFSLDTYDASFIFILIIIFTLGNSPLNIL